jgi:hypothetical protein
MTTHADNHDLDKLKRWEKDLEATPADAPPVFAIFLVSAEDRAAHDVFRAFRTRFEEQKLGFAHLVIFGQHGVSETARRLQARFGLEERVGPSLVLFSGLDSEPQIVSLPSGEKGDGYTDEGSGWRDALGGAVIEIDNEISREAEPLKTLKEICMELGGWN